MMLRQEICRCVSGLLATPKVFLAGNLRSENIYFSMALGLVSRRAHNRIPAPIERRTAKNRGKVR